MTEEQKELQKLAEECQALDGKIQRISIARKYSFGETSLMVDVDYDGMEGLLDFSEITDEDKAAGGKPKIYTPQKIVGRVRRLLSC